MPVSTKWTVANPGKLQPPETDDYDEWTNDQLRKECTQRKFKLSRNVTKEVRLAKLMEYDRIKEGIESGVIVEDTRKTKNCATRLMNVLFSDKFCDRVSCLGDTLSRRDLDTKNSNKTDLWKEILTDFLDPSKEEYGVLVSTDERLQVLDPTIIIQHDAGKLLSIWKNTMQKYAQAMVRFTKSGENENDFIMFCGNDIESAYLRSWLQVKPNLTNYVEGGMHDEDQFDSLNEGVPLTTEDDSVTLSTTTSNMDVKPPPGSSRKRKSMKGSPSSEVSQNDQNAAQIAAFTDQIGEAIMSAARIKAESRGNQVDEYQKLMDMRYKLEDKIEERKLAGRSTQTLEEELIELGGMITRVRENLKE